MSTFLAERKIEVISGYAERNLAHQPDLVLIGNAISRGNPEAEFVQDHRLRYCSPVHYLPAVAVLDNLKSDHAHIFPDPAAIQKTFRHFIRPIPRNGPLLADGDDANLAPLLDVTHCPVKRFGLGEGNAVRAFNRRLAS